MNTVRLGIISIAEFKALLTQQGQALFLKVARKTPRFYQFFSKSAAFEPIFEEK
jgi:hypothetical protein